MIKLILLINIILVLNSTLVYIGFATKGRCVHYFNGCCPGKQWDAERDMCVDCPSGYYWINCSRPCQYPYYGSKCSQTCSCEEENCDHMSGCKNAITSVMPSAIYEVPKTTTVDKIVTDVVSSKSHSVSTISRNVANNPLYKPLLILSIIVGVFIVAYLSVVAVEKYCI